MIKRIVCLILLLLLQNSFAKNDNEKKIKECALQNGIKVVLHEDFKMPLVMIGIIFHVGEADEPTDKFGMIDLVKKEFVNSELYDKFFDLGIECHMNSGYFYTQLLASMNPKSARDFFAHLSKAIPEIFPEDLEIYKKQLLLEYKLSSYCFSDAFSNNIAANVRLSNGNSLPMFQEKSLNSVTESDLKLFYKNNFRDCPITVIVSGAIGYKSLLKILHDSLSNLPPRRARPPFSLAKHEYRDVSLENKFTGNSVSYAYALSPEDNLKFGSFFDYTLQHEIEKYFNGIYKIAHCSVGDLLRNDRCVKLISLSQISTISLETLNSIYRAFLKKISTSGVSLESLEKIAERKRVSDRIIFVDLEDMCYAMLCECLCNRDVNGIYTAADDLKTINPKEFRSFLEKIFQQNALFRITTKFKLDE
ncbi:MAG: hypothetical protein LBB29_01445 [Holosporaceae bacterium]|jgi:predicted Zn-dependent peptidase|nr:hypothetical protein [Holosporaceae bacterium]